MAQGAFRSTRGKEGLFNNGYGIIDFPQQENNISYLLYKKHKNQFQMDQGLKYKSKTLILFKENVGEYIFSG